MRHQEVSLEHIISPRITKRNTAVAQQELKQSLLFLCSISKKKKINRKELKQSRQKNVMIQKLNFPGSVPPGGMESSLSRLALG
jgi:hypothetical protein